MQMAAKVNPSRLPISDDHALERIGQRYTSRAKCITWFPRKTRVLEPSGNVDALPRLELKLQLLFALNACVDQPEQCPRMY
jgi:hypothetical protein